MAPLDEFSFPSGHTLHAVAFTLVALAHYPGLAWLLPRAIGQQRALAFGLGGRTLDASTADDWGIAELAPDGDVAAALKDAADNLGGKHLWANTEMRRLLHASWETSRTELSQSEAVTLVRALLTRNKR